jgi:hypothetical protein
MKRSILLAYQLLTGLSDTATGLLLLLVPEFTLGLMRLRVGSDALPFLSYIGAFVLSVGLACLYGARPAMTLSPANLPDQARLEVVWLLTGITRALVAVFVVAKVLTSALRPGWGSVAITDGVFAAIQFIGLARGWVRHVRP